MGTELSTDTPVTSTYKAASTLSTLWLIARRQAREAIMTRTTFIMIGFFLVFQTAMVLFVLGPSVKDHSTKGLAATSLLLSFLLAFMGLMFSQSSIGIAAGVFAGDKERGALLPLLVTPASNTAIFGGKVLGAVLPALLYVAIGVILYFIEIAVFFGPGVASLISVGLFVLILLLITAFTLCGAALASVVSSRVATFQAAQTYSAFILTILSLAVSFLIFFLLSWEIWLFALIVLAVFVLDLLLILLAAATWQRGEVMAKQ
jgi:ABC-type Na+ efflux pump permease subunit